MRIFLLILTFSVLALADDKPVLLFEHDPSLLTTTIEVNVRSGAMLDPKGKAGVSNLLSDLILRGTEKKTRSEFQDSLERLGGTLSGSASTESIYLGGEVIKENTSAFLDLFEEALIHPSFPEKEFANLKTEMLAGIAHIKNANSSLGGLALRKHIFKGTPMEFPVNGTLTTVKNVSRTDVVNRYKEAFHQGNLLVAVASPIPEKEIRERFERIWKQLPTGTRQPNPVIPIKSPAKTEIIVVNKPKTSTGSLLMAQPGITANDPDRFALQLGNFSFGGEPLVSRLFVIVRSKLGWTYSIGSTYQALGGLTLQPGLFMVYSTPSVEFTAKSILKTADLWKEYRADGLKPDEITLAQESSINAYPFAFDSAAKRLGMRVRSELYGVPVLTPEEYAKTLNGVSNDSLKTMLEKHHPSKAWSISIVADVNEIKKQLEQEQANIPKEERLTITQVVTPDQVIR